MSKKYIGIKGILKHQIKNNVSFKWAWKKTIQDEEFVCVYKVIPKWSEELYTPAQLLKKINDC